MDITEAAKVATHPGGDWRAEKPPRAPGIGKGRAPPRRDTGPVLAARRTGPGSYCLIGAGASILVTAFSSG
jgi:hypothetical protein